MIQKNLQSTLFKVDPGFNITSDAEYMHKIMTLPKIDLHRHLTGSIDAEIAIRIATKYNIDLPAYISSELQDLLHNSRKVNILKNYISPWTVLNKLFVSTEAIHDILLEVIKKAAQDNVIYIELRMNPQGFLGKENEFNFEEFIETVSASVYEAENLFDITVRCILGLSRHISYGKGAIRYKRFAKIVNTISSFYPQCFVGVDLNGREGYVNSENFEFFFKLAKKKGLKITIHAGEEGPASNVLYAIEHLSANRIAHGFAAISDENLLHILAERDCALELCPTSNKILGMFSRISELPLETLQNYRIPFVICTDNPARCRTTLSEELFNIAKAFAFSFSQIKDINYSALNYSFADAETQKKLRSILNGYFDNFDKGNFL